MAKQKKSTRAGLYDLDYYKSLTGKEALEQRLLGRIPIIEIAGHPFFSDTRIGLLRPKDNFSTMGIDLQNLPLDEDNGTLSFYYHIPSMTRVDLPEILAYQDDVVLVTVPNMYELDPVGMARANGKEDTYYLDGEFPVMYRQASITPLSESPLAALLKGTIEKKPASKIQSGCKHPLPKTTKRKGI